MIWLIATSASVVRLLLAEVIANNHSLGDTEDITEQWKKFILELLSQL